MCSKEPVAGLGELQVGGPTVIFSRRKGMNLPLRVLPLPREAVYPARQARLCSDEGEEHCYIMSL